MSKKIKYIVSTLLEYFKLQEIQSSKAEKDAIWKNIESVVPKQEQRTKRISMSYVYLSAVAVLALIILVPVYIYTTTLSDDYLMEYAKNTDFPADSVDKQIKLILSDAEERLVQNEATITYSKGGAISVNQDTVVKKQQVVEKNESIVPNQIIIPKGKKSKLTLIDGSQLWINAGTRVIYPPVFEKDKREIYVEGEIYLEVAHDEERPFFVKTKDFNVEVLGTKFNVSAYSEENSSKVVLLDGSVKVNTSNHNTAKLTPDHLIDIKNGKLSKPVKVDVRQYVSWIDDMLIYKDEPLSTVFRKLNLYYGVNIEYDSAFFEVLVSGKLDLKKDFQEVLHTISYTAPVKFINHNDTIKAFYVK